MRGGYMEDLAKKKQNCQNWWVTTCTEMGACLGQYGIMVPNFPEIIPNSWFFETIVKINPPQARTSSLSQVQLEHTPVKCSIRSLCIESHLRERISGTLFICVHFYTKHWRNYVVKKIRNQDQP